MVMYQDSLCIRDGFFYSLQLLCDIQAATILLQHTDDAFQMSLGAFEAFYYFWVGGMRSHARIISSWGGYGNDTAISRFKVLLDFAVLYLWRA